MLGSVVIACFRVVGAGIGAPVLSDGSATQSCQKLAAEAGFLLVTDTLRHKKLPIFTIISSTCLLTDSEPAVYQISQAHTA